MAEFKTTTVCILGRQPQLGLAELESLYGAEHIRPIQNAALLDIGAEEINFKRLGGTVKVARLLKRIDSTDWDELARYLVDNVPGHMKHQPSGKFTFGLSVYGFSVTLKQIERVTLEVKKAIRQTGKSARVVPNKSPALNSAQVLHNKLTQKGAWELMFIKNGQETILAQTLFVQDIEAYGARDQARPARDARIGMLPPKLAQIIINLAAGRPETGLGQNWDRGDGLGRFMVLDPFCGTGVILQEALLMGYSAYGTDIEPRLADYSKRNLQWLVNEHPEIEGKLNIEVADATSYAWAGFSCIASETYLGRPLTRLPKEDILRQIVLDANTIIKKFLQNLSPQLKDGRAVCLAVPAWRRPDGSLIRLPLIDHLTDMGYNYLDLKHVERDELVYFREGQTVARQLLRINKH